MDLERVRIDTAAALAWAATAWDRTWNPSKLYVAGAIHRKQATDLFCPRSLHIHGQLFFFSFFCFLFYRSAADYNRAVTFISSEF